MIIVNFCLTNFLYVCYNGLINPEEVISMPIALNALEKIRRFSKIIYTLLKIAFVAYIVYGAFQLITMLLIQVQGPSAEGGIPLLVWQGTTVFMPMLPYATVAEAAEALARSIFTVIALGFGARVFRSLREVATPFCPAVVAGLKKLAIALLLAGLATGAAGFLAAGIAWVLYLIFDYGCALQNESDTTL